MKVPKLHAKTVDTAAVVVIVEARIGRRHLATINPASTGAPHPGGIARSLVWLGRWVDGITCIVVELVGGRLRRFVIIKGFPAVDGWITHARYGGRGVFVPVFGRSRSVERLGVLGEERDGGGIDHAGPAIAFCGDMPEVGRGKGTGKVAALGTGDEIFLGGGAGL